MEEKEYKKKYYQEHKTKIKKQHKKYYQEHKEQVATRNKKYYQEHKDNMNKKSHEYHKEHKKEEKEYHKKYRQENHEHIVAHSKNYRQENKEKIVMHRKEYNDAHKKERKEYRIKATFGLTLSEYNKIYISQKGCCAICKIPESEIKGRWKSLCADHNHKTGKVRGLLCPKCNTAIGFFQDDSKIVKEVLFYLDKFSSLTNS
jgi:hypothetical protein